MEDQFLRNPNSYPLILFPRELINLETDCGLKQNLFINLNITPNSPGFQERLYGGYCNMKIVDKYNITFESSASSVDLEVIEENNNSEVWIDPARSPYVYNDCQVENEIYIENNVQQNYTVQQHNTYITQNVFNYNDNAHFNIGDCEYRIIRQSNDNAEFNNSVNCDMYEEEEFECGVLLSQLSEEILNEERQTRERQFLSENSAFKQLISTSKKPAKHQKTILLIGDDPNNIHTVQAISVNDPNVVCSGNVASEVVIDDTTESGSRKIYQCSHCKQIFENISAFRQHMHGGHRVNYYDNCDDYKPKNFTSSFKNIPAIQFKCDECGKILKNQEKFEKHVNGHGDPELECSKCHKVYASKASLKAHQKLHNRQYPCKFCYQSFNTTQHLNTHIKKSHSNQVKTPEDVTANSETTAAIASLVPYVGNEKFVKNEINKSADVVLAKVMSNSAFLLNKPKRASKKTCEICSKDFDRTSDLKRHLIEHIVRSTLDKVPVSRRGNLHMECIICKSKIFKKIDQYKAHLREHAKLTLYKCTFCNKSFSDSSNFSKHKKIHTGARYHCDLCQRKFQTKRMIAKHMEYHLNNSPLPCKMCGKLFHFNSALNKHMKNQHNPLDYKMYQCIFCSRGFHTLKKKLDHEWVVHKNRKHAIDCMLCCEKFRKYSDLKKHCIVTHGVKIPMAKDLKKGKGKYDNIAFDI